MTRTFLDFSTVMRLSHYSQIVTFLWHPIPALQFKSLSGILSRHIWNLKVPSSSVFWTGSRPRPAYPELELELKKFFLAMLRIMQLSVYRALVKIILYKEVWLEVSVSWIKLFLFSFSNKFSLVYIFILFFVSYLSQFLFATFYCIFW